MMKKTLLILWILNSCFLYSSQAVQSTAVARDAKGNAVFRSVELKNLIDPNRLESPSFKIVYKKSNEALDLTELSRRDPDLMLKAVTVYYHLERVKDFFISTLHSPEAQKLEQIIVRLELTNVYSELGHFANDAKDPQFNNALSIPAGIPPDFAHVDPWGREIWFRPSHRVSTAELLSQLSGDPLDPTIHAIRSALYPMQLDQALRTTLYSLSNSRATTNSYIKSMTRQGTSLLLIEGAFQILKLVNRALIPGEYYLDTAFVPEIIVHEFSHIALSDWINITHSSPVIEGMADYFSAALFQSPKLAQKIKRYSSARGKDGSQKKLFQVEFESLDQANGDYVLGILWGMRKVLGVDLANALIFEARKSLDSKSSDIRAGLVSALLKSCESLCPSYNRDRLKLLQYFQSRGL